MLVKVDEDALYQMTLPRSRITGWGELFQCSHKAENCLDWCLFLVFIQY